MTETLRTDLHTAAASPSPLPIAPTLNSRDLFTGNREVVIEHGTDRYRLKLTGSNKLLLVK